MNSTRSEDAARLLDELEAGRSVPDEDLLPIVYDELRAQARLQMGRERADHTLQTTALVHEAFLRLWGKSDRWESRDHFLRVAARAMRRVLIDHARRKRAEVRGGGRGRESLDEIAEALEDASCELVSVDAALEKLARLDARMAEVVELRFFGGLTVEETARVLSISPRTVKSEWALARAWLKEDLSRE